MVLIPSRFDFRRRGFDPQRQFIKDIEITPAASATDASVKATEEQPSNFSLHAKKFTDIR